MKYFFTVGPSQLYPTVEGYIKKALEDDVFSMNHRGDVFGEMYQRIDTSLHTFLGIPKAYSVFFLGSATEGMERIIQNCVAKKSHHIITGSFGKRFYQIALDLKKQAEKYEVEFGLGVDVSKIKISKNIELIAVTQSDTSTGVVISESDIAALKKRNPHALIAVDVVSSIPYTNLDYSLMDAVFFSVQKGFGLPAGLGVLVLSPEAMEKSKWLKKKGYATSGFHSFEELHAYSLKHQTPETPNVFDIYLLDKVLHDMLRLGITNIRKDTDAKAHLMYDFFENHKDFAPFVKTHRDRAKTVLVIEVKGGSEGLVQRLKNKGIHVGSGYGPFKESHIRIANFPAHSMQMVKKLLNNL